jgi:integrase
MIEDPLTDPITHDFPCEGSHGESSCPLSLDNAVLVHKGHLFTTRAGGLLDSRNVLDVLQQAGRQGGYHAFRRFRFAVLRKAGAPDDLIKLWLGHSQNLIDLYAGNCGTTRLIGGNGARKLAWDLNWANWAIKAWHQFARH